MDQLLIKMVAMTQNTKPMLIKNHTIWIYSKINITQNRSDYSEFVLLVTRKVIPRLTWLEWQPKNHVKQNSHYANPKCNLFM